MDNSSLRGSTISLIESEPSITEFNKGIGKSRLGTGISSHKYNTRNSVQLKKLYVDLGSNRIDPNIISEFLNRQREPNLEVNAHAISNRINRRDSDTFSQDSRQFDINSNSFIDQLRFRLIMDERRRLCTPNPQQNTWKKYCYAFCALGMLYVYIQVIHTGENVRKLHKEIDTLKVDVRNAQSSSKINNMENILNNMKRDQEMYSRKVQDVVTKEMDKYSADKTGRTDFALETTGGKIINLIPGTENFDSAKTLFGVTLCEGIHGPRAMLQADMSPGHCWAFKGSHGGAVIKLLGKVQINGVSLEHISETVSPTGEISSAPKEFTVWGLNSINDRGQQFGTFIYHKFGPLVQTFPIANTNYYEFVEFRVMSNQGNPEFTCVYRFRVHGKLERDKEL